MLKYCKKSGQKKTLKTLKKNKKRIHYNLGAKTLANILVINKKQKYKIFNFLQKI